jgi:thiol:disulfide interchange protein
MKLKFDKVELSGLIVLFIGVILLALTFYCAWLFLVGELSILVTGDLLQSFGEALAPLIEAIIHVLFLGIMGWIGSIVTIRAVQLLKQDKTQTTQHNPANPQPQQQPTKTESKQSTLQPVPAPPVQVQPVEARSTSEEIKK